MNPRPLLTIVLAAGKGTRMKSSVPKVLHRIGGLSMLGHALAAAAGLGAARRAVVVAPDAEGVRAEARALAPDAEIFVQEPQLGTAHAVLAARAVLAGHAGDVLVLFADTPLIQPGTLVRLRACLDGDTDVAVLAFHAANPEGYGRLLMDPAGAVLAVREHKDATDEERAITLCCSGVMAFRGETMLGIVERIGTRNAQGEYYLTDAVSLARDAGRRAAAVVCPEEEVLGINSRSQLAAGEAVFQRRMREKAMAEGATLIAPETVWFSHDTRLGRDVTIEPNVFFGPGVVVEDEARIFACCHLEGARVRRGAQVGPFARLRRGADLGSGAKIGNFVEIKNTTLEAGAKSNHLAYLGDGHVGTGANIGAGTIFCNYDGYFKHRTTVGAGAFIGSNTALVAPVSIGEGAYVGSGSVITKDVPADALAIARSEQSIRVGWAGRFRAFMGRRKAARG